MKVKSVLIDEYQNEWFKSNHIIFSSWVRNKVFEFIQANGGFNESEKVMKNETKSRI